MRWPILFLTLFTFQCKTDKFALAPSTQNVIVIVMDGARYSETFGEPSMQYIPVMRSLLPQATYGTAFYNDGTTNTCNGHVAITTGVYENIDNGGNELPNYPGYPQIWIKEKKQATSKAWLITTKDKLEVLRNCKQSSWKDLYMPMTDCGNSGIFTGYRNDSTTCTEVLNKMSLLHPNLLIVNFKEPDASGHTGNWDNYLRGIRDVDAFIAQIWQYVQADPLYRDNTTLIVTNDHGRHSPNIADGFVSHGDACDGCRHIMFFAIGKGIPKGKVFGTRYSLTDLNITITTMLGISNPYGTGTPITELFEE